MQCVNKVVHYNKSIIMKKTAFILLLLLAAGLTAAAQSERTTFTGMITDKAGEELPFATITISYTESGEVVSYNQVADNLGRFRITTPLKPLFTVDCSYVGMTFEKIKVEGRAGIVDLGSLKMSTDSSTELSEVQVTAIRPVVKMGVDRMSYDTKNDPESKTVSVLEMLRKVPLVTVDGEEKIQVKGGTNFKIFVNGKPSPMFDQNPQHLLKSIPASSLKKIDIITEPGVKYSSEGVSAIINIVMDTGNKTDGLTGNVSLGAGLLMPATTTSAYLAMQKGKFGMMTNLSFNQVKRSSYSDSHIEYADRRNAYIHNDTDNKFKGLFGNMLLSYEFNKYNLLTLNTSFSPMRINNDMDLLNKEYDRAGKLSAEHNSWQENKKTFGSIETSLDYQITTPREGEYLTFSYRYNYQPNDARLTQEQDKFLTRSNSPSRMHEHTLQADYIRPLKNGTELDMGLKYIYRGSGAEPEYNIMKDGSWQPNPQFEGKLSASRFSHTFDIAAAYLAANYSKNGNTVRAGLRAEQSRMDVEYKDSHEADFDKKYFNLLSELTFSRAFASSQIKLHYEVNMARPAISMLNPYEEHTSDYMIVKGNPDLRPEKNNIMSLAYNTYSRKLMLNLSLDHRFTNNAIVNYLELAEDGVSSCSTSGNIGRQRKTSMNLYLNYTATPWLKIMLNASGGYVHQKVKLINLRHHGWNATTHGQLMFTLPSDWNMSLYAGQYYGGHVSPQMYVKNMCWNGMSVSKKIKRFNLSLTVNNPFSEYIKSDVVMTTPALRRHIKAWNQARQFSFSLSYSFGRMNSRVKRTVKTIQNTDLMQDSDKTKQGGQGM